jgi:secreted trypsin-like serine protease
MSRSLCFLFLASKILANPDLNGRIIGGTPAHVYKLPYQVSLQNEDGHMCGGSIIHKSYILTAALLDRGKKIEY